jgi:hypothetical protein
MFEASVFDIVFERHHDHGAPGRPDPFNGAGVDRWLAWLRGCARPWKSVLSRLASAPRRR